MSLFRLARPVPGMPDVEREAAAAAKEARRVNAEAAHASLVAQLEGERARLAQYDADLAAIAAEYKAATEPWRKRRVQLRLDELEERRDRRAGIIRSLEADVKKGPQP